MKEKILVSCLVLACFALLGCSSDPSEEALKRGQNIDIGKLRGKVLEVGIRYFEGENSYTIELRGKPYYWAKISYTKEDGTSTEEIFYGILPEVHDILKPGMELPASTFLSLLTLTKMEGDVVDMDRNLDEDKFWIVVNNIEGLKKYRVDMKTYYTLVHVGTKLPLNPDLVDR